MDRNEINNIIDEIWKFYDKNNNGTIEGKELKILFTDIFKISGDSIFISQQKKILEMIDLNNDGKLSKDELKQILSN